MESRNATGWPRRHELMDVDLDAYEENAEPDATDATQPAERPRERVAREEPVSVLNAAERAGIPLEELLPKLRP